MRNCDNCEFSSYGLDCSTGVETLNCRETEYEYEVSPSDTCEDHQFIDGMEDEKNYVMYDETYFGQGYFIIHKNGDEITKFIKIYITNNDGFPSYAIRAFSIDARDIPDSEFTNIDFVFRSNEDFANGLFNIFKELSKNINVKLETIDSFKQGRNNMVLSVNNRSVRVTISKDVFRGKQHPSDFIDIDLGDNYTCQNYEAINSFYNSLAALCPQTAREEDIKRLLMLKVK